MTTEATKISPCLVGFEHVNRYWDKRHKCFVAKILPGEFYVTAQNEAIATVLGSCVSACVWDEEVGIGGMNHFMLPLTDKDVHSITWGTRLVPGEATRYGNYAMEHMINEILNNGGRRGALKAKVFGGGKIIANMSDVGLRNAEFVLDYLHTERIPLLADSLGDNYPRKVMFIPASGKAYMRKLKSMHNDTILSRESNYGNTILSKPVDGDIELFS
ncbi:chemoreceptor glutamine deamidase CheD [Ketobacter sp. MCCC 1A13808]|uniref:chemoreceptor glutamine deamidase CheD n=1 Tax=Ketobacter sp. MCCC 1A13808 TaxID=2602738 RepID=UPI000F155CC0|nr:chemoreceptor glutamine deamidase CheD [Ketobacter sp. MCCC 1A13808]MVF13205.1 chemoreceptor glutamine deamidase CheD [Ketobacter sp. MCCC 1A13808]RLP54357.1 MAG: chemoreceptor glutamine deamidase CheD [Ketobacter sp.]